MTTSTTYSEEEYLRIEHAALERSELLFGQIKQITPEPIDHGRVRENFCGEMGVLLKNKRPCRSYSCAQRIYVPLHSFYTYPDIIVVCSANQYAVPDSNSITNPLLIVEVLSLATANYDRGEKFRLYRDIDSLQEYVMIHSLRVAAQVFRRTADNQWILADDAFSVADNITIETIGATLQMADLYDGTENVSGL